VESYNRYWGKANQNYGSDGVPYHLLVFHSLDVAAVGYVLLKSNHAFLERLSHMTALEPQDFISWFTFLLAFHDIGKFADSFQNLNPQVLQNLQQRTSNREYGLRHDSLGLILWKNHLRGQFQEQGLIPQVSGSKRRRAAEHPIDFWMGAMFGHHGQPPQPSSNRLLQDDFDETNDFAAASAFLDDLIPILLPKEITFPDCDLQSIQLVSWWLSGLAVLCDWLGSNTQFFPYQKQPVLLADYWEQTRQRAEKAVCDSGILSSQPSVSLKLSDLIEIQPGITPEPTPLQALVADWDISPSPHLFILEDVTGAGKTEAAVLLAHRLMNAGQANSLYFALPTMATSNTMYSRMREVYRKLFAVESLPSLVLAHGASDMSEEFRQSIVPETATTTDDNGDGTLPAEAHCNAWLADNRKKALLADVGIGTVDQALLAILPSRHQSLRMLGLVNKILLVDEVHACDAYMHELLCALLRAHAVAGGSVILLSATLPKKQRQALLDAYAEGQHWSKPTVQAIDHQSYPLVSCLSETGLQEQVVATREIVKREVCVKFLSDREAVDTVLADIVGQGQCACWIRNTVKDAIEAYQQIRELYPDWEVDLFHARYALGDRIEIEKRVVERFGKNSTHEQRKGQILIATQVVEQSLDLDFDALITDLSPIDLVIQRAGRLRRHTRNKDGNRIPGEDQRGKVTLNIFSPEVIQLPAADWYARFFPNAQKVYENHGQLWLTANLLHKKGGFRMPEDARNLIEGVYGADEQADIPEVLLDQSFEAEGNDRANASIARLNALSIEAGYTDTATNCWWDEAKTPTRLGEQTTTVYLAKWQDGHLTPWHSHEQHAWQLSAVSMRTYWIAEETTTAEITRELIDQCKATLPAKGKWGVLLPLTHISGDDWQGVASNEKKETVRFLYNEKFGLVMDL
jgi:CRISPR-associated endonuclease/helicase Cas3